MEKEKNKRSSRRIPVRVIVAICVIAALAGFIVFAIFRNDGTTPVTVNNGWAQLTLNHTVVVGSPADTIADFAELIPLREGIYFNMRYCEAEDGTVYTMPYRSGSALGSGGMNPDWPVQMDLFIVHHAEPTSYWCDFLVEITDTETEEMRELRIPIYVTIEN